MLKPSIENFLAFERENKCNSINVEGIPVWSLYRYEIHNAIKRDTVGRVDGSQTAFSKSELWKMFLNSLRPFTYKNVDVLFVGDGARNKNLETGVFENIYFDEVAKKYNSVILEHPVDHRHKEPNGMNNVYFTDRVAFQTNIAIKLSKKFNTVRRRKYELEVRQAFKDIFEKIKNIFGPDLYEEMVPQLVDRMYYFEINKKYCGNILDKAQPKLIIEMCYYAMECFAMSALGKERGILTAEYSHGFAFPTHTPMQFNPEERISVLPDAELIYSHSQDTIVHMPENIPLITVGFPFFEREREKYKAKYPRDEKTICFISTLAEGEQISKLASEMANKIGDEYHIIYKLHPHEFGYYKEKFPWLVNEKLEVIDNTDNHIFKYLAESKICIGTRTASIWEAIGFGCETILLNYGDTAINMEYFIKEKNVPLADTVDEVIDLISRDAAGKVDPDGMFEPNAMQNICNYIDEKIRG